MNVAIYARVSTKDKGQETETQVRQLKGYIAKMDNWTLTHEYIDEASAKDTNRPEFKRMLEDASRREFDVLLFWSLDRLSREGTLKTHQLLETLNSHGVMWKSFTEQYLDTCGIFKEAVVSILAVIAKQEHLRIRERTLAGLKRYREDFQRGVIGKEKSSRSGKNLGIGRPKRIFDRERVRKLSAEGLSVRKIAAELRIGFGTVRRTLRGEPKFVSDPKEKRV